MAQVYSQVGDEAPDLDDPIALRAFFAATRELMGNGTLLAYHDRSDGGLFVTLCEMAFAGRSGLEIELEGSDSVLPTLFAEEAGAVFQVRDDDIPVLDRVLAQHGETDDRGQGAIGVHFVVSVDVRPLRPRRSPSAAVGAAAVAVCHFRRC